MQNKYMIILTLICLFLGMNNVSAATNQCTLEDESLWKYETTLEGRNAVNTKNAKTYEHSKCCTNSSGTTICDFYSAIKKGTETGASEEKETVTTGKNIDYCTGLNSTFVFIGHIVQIAKIFIPIVIIGFGMLDFFKAVTGSKDDEIKKSIKSLIARCIAGVCIFFLPAVITLVFSWVDGWSAGYEGKTNECFKCIWNVGSCTK